MPSGPQRTEAARTRQRAKQACRECNARRVRCNVNDSQPCANCRSSGKTCEILPSKRGRYPRKSRQNLPDDTSDDPTASVNTESHAGSQDGEAREGRHIQPNLPHITSLPPGTASSFFFGESNLLTSVPRSTPAPHEPQGGSLSYPGMFDTPRTGSHGADTATCRAERYLRDELALTFPDLQSCLPALRAYFEWFHPCFPVVSRADIASCLISTTISPLLFQAMLFISATYCDDDIITAMGFSSRFEAKSSFYNRARLLFDADWEKDQLTVLQALFLMSFWRGGPSNIRDVRYWLGVSITLAQTFGLHRSTEFTTRDLNIAALRRRIWWSIYVRERQAAASLGLPSRIRDEDCDIEILTAADLEKDVDNDPNTNFGAFVPEQIVYVTSMVEIARLLGRIIDIHFVPGRVPSPQDSVHSLKDALEQWRHNLPIEMRNVPEPEQTSVWVHLLHLAYNHLRILIHRGAFLRTHDSSEKKAVIGAACRISRIAEDMLAQKTIRFGQMHLITGLFAALCIHVIEIRTADGVAKKLAENRAQMCLLGLKEIQKYWSINNLVLDLFFQYLDESTAKRLHGDQPGSTRDQTNAAIGYDGSTCTEAASATAENANIPATSLQTQPEALESDLYLNFFSTSWEGVDNSTLDFSLLLDPSQRPTAVV